MNKALKTLQDRGFIKECTNMDALSALMDKESVTFYVGADPTGKSLHIGHMVPFFAMHHLQLAGHNPIALVGGGTAMIGDPSGKTEVRKMLTPEEVASNCASIKEQLGTVVDFSETPPAGVGKAVMLNNADWLTNLNYIDFLREIGRHFSVNRMLTFESYKARLERGLSFIEFNYHFCNPMISSPSIGSMAAACRSAVMINGVILLLASTLSGRLNRRSVMV